MAEEFARWLTLKQFAELTQISMTLAYAEVRSGRLKAAHVGGGRSIRVPPSALEDYERLCSGDEGAATGSTPAAARGSQVRNGHRSRS